MEAYEEFCLHGSGSTSTLFSGEEIYSSAYAGGCKRRIKESGSVKETWICTRKNGHNGPHDARCGGSLTRAMWYTSSDQI